jgi:hypothetical protein
VTHDESGVDIPRYEIAEQALGKIEDIFACAEDADWAQAEPVQDIRHAVRLANARLRMRLMERDRRRPRWFGKVTSGVYGRGFMKPGEFGKDPDPHLCFVIEITDGVKSAQGKRVEVQGPDSELEFLAGQILSMVELRKRMQAESGEEK